MSVLFEGHKAVVAIVGEGVDHHAETHDKIFAGVLHRKPRQLEVLDGGVAEQIPAYEQLKPEANEESYSKETGFLHDVLVGLEHPLAVPDKAVDHAENIAGDVGYGVGQAQDGVEQIEHDERDERVADTDDAVFQKLYGSLFCLIVHCCGFLVFVVAENGYRPVVFYGKQADGNDGDSTGNLLHRTGKSGKHGEPVDNAAGYARRSVDVLAENQRFFVDEDVADYATQRTGDGAHEDGHPHGVVEHEGFLYADDDKQTEADGVEEKERAVESDKLLAEEDDVEQRYSRDGEIPAVDHPEGSRVEENVAQRTAADGRHKADDIGSEPVELLSRGKAYAADGKGDGSDDFDDEQ